MAAPLVNGSIKLQASATGLEQLSKASPEFSKQHSPTAGQPFTRFINLLLSHLVVALVALVVIGGATRVMQAGLACPDWPLCYGSLLPGRQMNLQVFLEWFHRLDAFLVGLALLSLCVISLIRRALTPGWLRRGAVLALLLVAFQGGLGALTVSGLLDAETVTAHLLTALILVGLISALAEGFRLESLPHHSGSQQTLPAWWWLALSLTSLSLLVQCGLGGAMASRWAASLCLQSGEGCRWLLLHRAAAWLAFATLITPILLVPVLPPSHRSLWRLALPLALLAPAQVALGILTFRLQLTQPAITIAHQFLAALLVATAGALWGHWLPTQQRQASSLNPSLQAHG